MSHYSYTPIDLGFDPRVHDMPVTLPSDATSVELSTPGQAPVRVTGSRPEMISAMAQAGFQGVDEPI